MSVVLCTFIGIDNCTDPNELLKISEQYPIVEWSYNLIGKQIDSALSLGPWFEAFVDMIQHAPTINASIQINEDLINDPGMMHRFNDWSVFKRIQFDTRLPPKPDHIACLSQTGKRYTIPCNPTHNNIFPYEEYLSTGNTPSMHGFRVINDNYLVKNILDHIASMGMFDSKTWIELITPKDSMGMADYHFVKTILKQIEDENKLLH